MGCLIILLLFLWFVAAVITFVNWLYHSIENKCGNWAYGNFSKFKSEFEKNNPYKRHKDDIFLFTNVDNQSLINTVEIKFNGRHMVLDYLSYGRFLWFIWRRRVKKKENVW